MTHILVVDDDERLRALLKRFLEKQDYQVSTAPDAAMARKLTQVIDFDILIVDVMMPGEDGIRFVQNLRENNDVPVLMLTAKASLDDRLEGFDAGVDDFLAKPFEPRELVSRVEAILRRARSDGERQGVAVFGEFHYDFSTQKLSKGHEKIELTRNERDVLLELLNHRAEICAREDLLHVFDDETNLRNVDVTITRLRKKLENDPKNPQYIHTIRGQGYKLQPPS